MMVKRGIHKQQEEEDGQNDDEKAEGVWFC